MASETVSKFLYVLNDYWTQVQDPRTTHLPLVNGTPWPLCVLMFIYAILVIKIIPEMMKDRAPFEIRRLILAYNIFMVFANLYFFCFFITRTNYGMRFLNFTYPPHSDNSPYVQSETIHGKQSIFENTIFAII